MSPEPLVLFQTPRRQLKRRELQAFALRLSGEVAAGAVFCCLVTGDEELRRLNREFRGKDEATDVLSFPSASPGGALGDIAISADRAALQAAQYGHDIATEIRVLMLHGLLHLLGHDHERDGGRMRRLESRWRERLGLPKGLIERAK